MHIPDLDACRYHGGPFDHANWSVPLRAVGGLAHPHPFTSGTVTRTVISKLASKSVKLQRSARATACSHSVRDVTAGVGPIF